MDSIPLSPLSTRSRERSPVAAAGKLSAILCKQLRRVGPLGAIIVLHIAFFYALQSGLIRQAVEAIPKEVVVSFITPERTPEAPKPQPQPPVPKTVPVVKKSVTPPPAPTPVVNNTPSPQAITVPAAPPSPPAPPESAAPAVAAAPPVSSGPRTVTNGIEYLQAPKPEYPAMSRRMNEEGKAILRVLVNEKGRAERVEVQTSSGSARLDEAARQAVLRAVFKPFIEDGKAVAAFAIIPIRFQLDN
jgi:periplasmic protein TonB